MTRNAHLRSRDALELAESQGVNLASVPGVRDEGEIIKEDRGVTGANIRQWVVSLLQTVLVSPGGVSA